MKYLIVLFALLVAVNGQARELECWQDRCHECKENKMPTERQTCNFRSIVSEEWIRPLPDNNQVSPYGPGNDTNKTDFEYTCLKFKATDPKISGDSTIHVKGCYQKDGAEKFCDKLKELANAVNKTNVDCSFCDSDFCNGSPLIKGTIIASIVALLLAFLNN